MLPRSSNRNGERLQSLGRRKRTRTHHQGSSMIVIVGNTLVSILLFVGVIAFVFSFSSNCSATPINTNDLTIRVGISDWISDSDGTNMDDSYRIIAVSAAAQYVMAMQHFNERNTTVVPDLAKLASCPFNLSISRICDDGAMPLKAAIDANDFIQRDDVHALIGYSDFETAKTISIVAQTIAEIPVVSNWAQGDALSSRRDYPNFARTWTTDRQYSEHIVDLIVQFGYKKIAFMYLNIDSGPMLMQSVTVALTALSISVKTFAFEPDDQASINRTVELVAQSEANVILCATYTDDLVASIARAAHRNGLTTTQLWILTYMDAAIELDSIDQDESLQAFLYGSIRLQHMARGQLFRRYVNEIWPEYGEAELTKINSYLPPFGQANELRCINSNLSVKFEDYSDAQKDFFRKTVYRGNGLNNWAETYDAILAVGFAACSAAGATGGTVPRNSTLLDALLRVNFTGMSGQVQFDANGDRLSTSLEFSLDNWERNAEGKVRLLNESFKYDVAARRFLITDEIQFRQGRGMENLPSDVIVPAHNRNLLGGLKILGHVEVAVIIALTVTTLAWIVYNRNDQVVRNSQPELLSLIVFGCLIATFSIFFMSIPDNSEGVPMMDANIACNATPILFFVGFQMAMLAFIFKTMRVVWIYTNQSLRSRRMVRLQRLLIVITLLLAVETILCIVWATTFPLVFERTIIFADTNGNPVESTGFCYPSSSASLGFLIAVGTFHAASLIGCAYAANQAKNIPTEYHDSKYLALAILSLTQMYLLGVPVLVAAYDSASGRYIVITSLVFLSSLFLWFAAIVPKVYYFYTGKELIVFSGKTSQDGDDHGANNNNKRSAKDVPVPSRAPQGAAIHNKKARDQQSSVDPMDHDGSVVKVNGNQGQSWHDSMINAV